MHLTIPRDVIESIIDSVHRDKTTDVGLIHGQNIKSESLIQVWGVTTLDTGITIEELIDEYDSIQELQNSDKLQEDKFSTQISAFNPPGVDVRPVGMVVAGSREEDLPDGTEIPIIQVNRTHGNNGSTPEDAPTETLTVNDESWEISVISPTESSGLEIIHGKRDAKKRIDGLIDTDLLEESHITIVGLGTVGSSVAIELVKAGVGSLTLIDYDRLEIHNVTRHVCGIDDLGRKKTHAVRDLIHQTNPKTTVETIDSDVTKQTERFEQIAADSDVVAVCTDTDESKLIINRLCLQTDVPAVYGGVYERAMGGDVIRIRPGETPCYDCVLGNMSKEMERDERTAGEPDYGETSEEQPGPEPGISVDVGFISLIQTKYILTTLLRNSEMDTTRFEHDMVFWGNENEYIFTKQLQSRFARISYRDDCFTCGGTGTVSKQVSDVDSDDILESIPQVDEDPRSS